MGPVIGLVLRTETTQDSQSGSGSGDALRRMDHHLLFDSQPVDDYLFWEHAEADWPVHCKYSKALAELQIQCIRSAGKFHGAIVAKAP